MFGGLKKKLQEAITRVTAPKKEEIEKEILKEEQEEQKKEFKEEVEELVLKEKEARGLIENRQIEKGDQKIKLLDKDIEANLEKEKLILEKIEEETLREQKLDIEEIAKEEFEKITHQKEAEEKKAREELEKRRIADELSALQAEEIGKIKEREKYTGKAEQKVSRPEKFEMEEDIKTDELTKEKEIPAQEEQKKEKLSPFSLLRQKLGKPAEKTVIEEEAIETEKLEAKAEEKIDKKRGFISSIVRKIAEKTVEESDIKEIIKNLELALLENDTALEVAEKISDEVKASLVGKSVKRGDLEDSVKEALKSAMLDVMKQEKIDIDNLVSQRSEPLLVMFLGFNGTGKTTTLAKFAYKYRNFNPVIAAGDTFRAASIEQLEEHGKKLGMRVVKQDYGSDSAAVIFDARKHASSTGSKLVVADTAGRSHSNVNLMDELKKVVRVNKPDLKILILDSMTGNDIYEQARLFNDAVGIDAIILTKADVYDKGGAALSAAYTTKKPIMFLGMGQNYDDLKEFRPEEIVANLLD